MFTEREIEILKLLVQGLNNAEIAQKLYFSKAVIKASISTIMAKLEAKNRIQAAVKAIRQGFIEY